MTKHFTSGSRVILFFRCSWSFTNGKYKSKTILKNYKSFYVVQNVIIKCWLSLKDGDSELKKKKMTPNIWEPKSTDFFYEKRGISLGVQ